MLKDSTTKGQESEVAGSKKMGGGGRGLYNSDKWTSGGNLGSV